MHDLSPNETIIKGEWLFDGKEITSDDSCERIKWLISKVLKKIATDASGWETLYKDPKDNRLWLMYYPQGEMQAGGPPSLRLITKDEAELKFNAK